jgi:hypothetical protein
MHSRRSFLAALGAAAPAAVAAVALTPPPCVVRTNGTTVEINGNDVAGDLTIECPSAARVITTANKVGHSLDINTVTMRLGYGR